jgi:hypothetical protein
MYVRIEGETVFFLGQPTGIRIHLHHVNKRCQQLHHAYTNSSAIDNSKSICIQVVEMKVKSGLTKFAPNDLYKMDFKMQIELVLNRKLVSFSLYNQRAQ